MLRVILGIIAVLTTFASACNPEDIGDGDVRFGGAGDPAAGEGGSPGSGQADHKGSNLTLKDFVPSAVEAIDTGTTAGSVPAYDIMGQERPKGSAPIAVSSK